MKIVLTYYNIYSVAFPETDNMLTANKKMLKKKSEEFCNMRSIPGRQAFQITSSIFNIFGCNLIELHPSAFTSSV